LRDYCCSPLTCWGRYHSGGRRNRHFYLITSKRIKYQYIVYSRTREAMYVSRNTEVRSRNHCFRGKLQVLNLQSECVFCCLRVWLHWSQNRHNTANQHLSGHTLQERVVTFKPTTVLSIPTTLESYAHCSKYLARLSARNKLTLLAPDSRGR
jgi:hypothetical protein